MLCCCYGVVQDIFDKVDKSGEGVCVQASTLGSLEALLSFLDSGGYTDTEELPGNSEYLYQVWMAHGPN